MKGIVPVLFQITQGLRGFDSQPSLLKFRKWDAKYDLARKINIIYIGIMKTTIDIPESEMVNAMRFTRAKTKRAAVNGAIAEFNRRQRVAELAKYFGTFKSMMTNEEIEADQFRHQEGHRHGAR